MSREERISVYEDTKRASSAFRDPEASIKCFYADSNEYVRLYDTTAVDVLPYDTISCTKILLDSGYNPVALNFSDDLLAGGYVEAGSAAQEESLFRQTNYFKTLLQSFYPLKAGEAVYSRDITVFKGAEHDGWPAIDPFEMHFIACPAIKYPRTCDGRLSRSDVDRFKVQMETVLQTAAVHGHDSVVLGSWGCGAWRCPAEHTAELFKEVLREYDGVFARIVFGIIPAPTSTESFLHHNAFDVFKRVLD